MRREGSMISREIIFKKKERRKRRENKKLRTFSYDSNVEAVIMAHFLNRAVILDSSDKRKVTRASGSATILNYRVQFQFIDT